MLRVRIGADSAFQSFWSDPRSSTLAFLLKKPGRFCFLMPYSCCLLPSCASRSIQPVTSPRFRVKTASFIPGKDASLEATIHLGHDMQGSEMHQTLLAAYDKLFAPAADVPA